MGKTTQREGTLAQNLERTLAKHSELLSINSKLAALNDPDNTTRDKKSKIEKLETSVREAMGELKRARESATKEIENQGKSKTWHVYDVPEEVLDDTAEPTSKDITGMLKAVLDRTRPKESVKKLSETITTIDFLFKRRDKMGQIATIQRSDKSLPKNHLM